MKRIAADPDDFYHGEIAKKLAADMQAHGGLITEADLAHYQVKERVPVEGTYHGYKIFSAPPPSAGGIALVEMLNILRPYDLAKLGDRTPAEKFSASPRPCAAPTWTAPTISATLTTQKSRRLRCSISPTPMPGAKASCSTSATPSKDLKRPAGFLPPPPAATVAESKSTDTTHYSVLDSEGNAVAVTTTLNDGFGSHVTATGLGFLLNNEMDDFASKQGTPNMYGLIQGPNNAIAPHHRPLSAMTPTIVLKDGKVRMVLGSPGGPTITTTVLNIFLSTAEGGLNIQQAVDAPRFHHQYLPDILDVEAGFPADTATKLRAEGYTLKQRRPLGRRRMHRGRSQDSPASWKAARTTATTTAKPLGTDPVHAAKGAAAARSQQ